MLNANGSAVFLLVFSFALAGSSPAECSDKRAPIRNFRAISSDLSRGGRPESQGLHYLKRIGVKTILNLENSRENVGDEMREAAALGIRVISIPMGYGPPSDRKVNRALEVIADRHLRPLYVHCRAGRDRTGVGMAVARVEQQGWDPRAAYEEMLRFGHHKALFWFGAYVKNRTGYSGLSGEDLH